MTSNLQVTDSPFVNDTGACLVGQGTEGIWFGGYRPSYANCTVDSAIFQAWLLEPHPYSGCMRLAHKLQC